MVGMMRVAFTSLSPFVSGAERSLQVTIRALGARGVESLVLGPAGAKMEPWCREHGVEFVSTPLPLRDKWHPIRWFRAVTQLRRLLTARQVDVIHANQIWSYPAPATAGQALGIPRVCHLRDEASPATLRWCCAAGVEAVIAISRHIARQAEAAWAGEPGAPAIETWINPVALPSLGTSTEREQARADARTRFGIAADVTVFGFIGQIREVKGLLELLEALGALTHARPWQLLVAGRDPNPGAHYEHRCRERAAQADLAGRVRFLGFLEDTAAFYRAIDVAVVPSLEEPLGRVPLEAGAFERPSIAFATGGLPEVIRNGETGWLVATSDITGLRERLRMSLDEPSVTMGMAARVWVEAVSDPNAYATRLAELYARLREAATTARPQPATAAARNNVSTVTNAGQDRAR